MISEFNYGQTRQIWPYPFSLSLYSTFKLFCCCTFSLVFVHGNKLMEGEDELPNCSTSDAHQLRWPAEWFIGSPYCGAVFCLIILTKSGSSYKFHLFPFAFRRTNTNRHEILSYRNDLLEERNLKRQSFRYILWIRCSEKLANFAGKQLRWILF